jgi:polysaccharide biosynthesis transport protein
MSFDLKFYWALLRRRLPVILLIVSLTTAAGIVLAYRLPPVYRAQARLLVESPQIPDDLAASTVRNTADEILLGIQQRLVTRANLLELSRQYTIHAETPQMTADQIVEDMRRRILFTLPAMRPNQTTGVVTVSFDSSVPGQSATVTNALVTQILQQNVEFRTTTSGGTLDFFQQEVRRLSEEMTQQNARILEFKEANRDALPESLDYRRSRQSAQQERLLQIDRELAGLRDRRQRLSDLFDRTGLVGTTGVTLSPEQTRLDQLRQELASSLVIYSPQNPRVRALQTQVAALEEVVRQQTGATETPGMTAFDLQVADIDGQIDFLAQQKALLERELAALEASIEATPRNAITLGGLESDHENLRVQYNQAVGSLAEARMGDRIEVTARGQRIAVVEPATVPVQPAKPNRKLVAAAGFGAGLALSAALMILLEMTNQAVRRPVELVSALGITPFGTIPLMRTRADIWRRRIAYFGATATVVAGVPLALYLVHLHYMPMDLLIERIAEQAGLTPLLERLRNGTVG